MEPLKPLHQSAISTALEKARHYRLLNDPENAESICLDIIELESDNQEALKTLVLSMTDQFDGGSSSMRAAREYVARLTSPYDQAYHNGLILERGARAQLSRGKPENFYTAHEWLQKARELYEEVESLSDDDNDDAILRWNACTRTIANRNLEPRPDDSHLQPYGDS